MLTDDIKKKLDALSDEDIFKAITACDGKRTCMDAGCPLYGFEMNCSYAFPYLLYNKLSALVKLNSDYENLEFNYDKLCISNEKYRQFIIDSADDEEDTFQEIMDTIQTSIKKKVSDYCKLAVTGLIPQEKLSLIIDNIFKEYTT